MRDNMKDEIITLCLSNNIDLLDIKTIQTVALTIKRYDLLVYLNDHAIEYISYVKNRKKETRLGDE